MDTKAALADTLEGIDPKAAESFRQGQLTQSDANALVASYTAEKLADLEQRIAALEADTEGDREPGDLD